MASVIVVNRWMQEADINHSSKKETDGMAQEKKQEEKENNVMLRVANVIVDKRNLIFLIFIIMIIFSLFSSNWVKVENKLTAFLPDDSKTKQSLDVMAEQFVTYGTARVMIDGITYDEAEDLSAALLSVEGVMMVTFDNTADHYTDGSALYDITFAYPDSDDRCLESLECVKKLLEPYDMYLSTELGDTLSEIIANEMQGVIMIVAVIVVIVLILTSSAYAEVPVLILTFVASALINNGTNFLLGTISFVSNSVTSVLQLALSVDYAVIFCNRYKEEHENLSIHDAVVVALSKAIPEITASSLTTVGGLAAMMFMQFKIGPDMAICLIKAVFCSLLSVFLLMPGLLMLFGKRIDKTKHKKFIPDIPFVGKFAYKTRYVVPPIFLVIVVITFVLSQKCPYVYGYSSLTTPVLNEAQIAENMIDESFGSQNMVALVVPKDSYKTEKEMLEELDACEEVDYSMGLSNIEAMGGYCLADQLTPRQFSELIDLDYEMAELVYTAYAVDKEEYGKIVGGIDSYHVALVDMFFFMYDMVQEGYVTLDDEQMEMLEDGYTQMSAAKKQLSGEEYNRVLLYLSLPEGGQETYDFLDHIYEVAESYYPEGHIYLAGNSTSEQDFKTSFSTDNIGVSIVSILVVLTVLLFTFMSVGMPVLLILVIQGCIWLNFSFPTVMHDDVFFMSYLVVSSIQMGANIDYAIVISSRFMELKDKMTKKQAMIETLNFAFPTIITSGSMLSVAGILIGQMTSDAAICGIGQSLGRGTIISIITVMFVLPQLLLLGEKIIDVSSFSMNSPIRRTTRVGMTRIDGVVTGEIAGHIHGIVHAYVDGEVDINLVRGTAEADAVSRPQACIEEKGAEDENA